AVPAPTSRGETLPSLHRPAARPACRGPRPLRRICAPMQDYEKLGVFYLGRRYDPDKAAALDEALLYDARDLVTHGVIVGMTGSGKTGLAISLLEELAIDGIPALAIDPKGDLG